MPWEDQVKRKAVESRARRARLRGVVEETGFPFGLLGVDLDPREEGRFLDTTGETPMGFQTMGEMP
jgi:hypothetical protein